MKTLAVSVISLSFLCFPDCFYMGRKCLWKRDRKAKTEEHRHRSVCVSCMFVSLCTFVCFVWVICAKTDLGPEVTLLCAPVVHMGWKCSTHTHTCTHVRTLTHSFYLKEMNDDDGAAQQSSKRESKQLVYLIRITDSPILSLSSNSGWNNLNTH